MTYTKRKLSQVVKKVILSEFNFINLKRRSKIDDLLFGNDLLFDCLNVIEFQMAIEEELGIQIDYDSDNHNYEEMTVSQFVDVLYEFLHVNGENIK